MSEAADTKKHRDGVKLTLFEKNSDRLPIWAPSARGSEQVHEFDVSWIRAGARVRTYSSGPWGNLRSDDKITLAALYQLWAEQGKDAGGKLRFRISELVELLKAGNGGTNYQTVKASLNRLRFCGVDFLDCFADEQPNAHTELKKTILAELFLVEPKINGTKTQLALPLHSTTTLDLDMVQNLIGGRSRPVSLPLLMQLSERGVLFEGYIGRLLYVARRHQRSSQTKDVFELWHELGLSTDFAKGYGSNLKPKMIRDLDVMVAHPASPLGAYHFEKKAKSTGDRRGLNLVLRRKAGDLKAHLQAVPAPIRKRDIAPSTAASTQVPRNPGSRRPAQTEGLRSVEDIAATITRNLDRPKKAAFPSDANPYLADDLLEMYGNPQRNKKLFQIIAERMPATNLLHEWGRVKEDTSIRNPAAVLTQNCLNWLEEQGISHPVKRRHKR